MEAGFGSGAWRLGGHGRRLGKGRIPGRGGERGREDIEVSRMGVGGC